MKRASIATLVLASILFPALAYAQTPQQGTVSAPAQGGNLTPQQGNTLTPVQGTISAGPSIQKTAHLENPLGNTVNSLPDLFYKIVNFLISFSYIVIAFFLILSGFKFVLAQGSDTELQKAKQMFYYTIIGGLIIVGAQTITTIVQNIIKGLQ